MNPGHRLYGGRGGCGGNRSRQAISLRHVLAGARTNSHGFGMTIRVECYSGYRGEQEPLAFWLGDRRLPVRALVDRWYGPGQRWYKVEVEELDEDDRAMYVLRHDEASGDWEIAAYRRPA